MRTGLKALLQPAVRESPLRVVDQIPISMAADNCRQSQAIAGYREHGRTHFLASTWLLQCMYGGVPGALHERDFWEAVAVSCPVHDLRVKC